MLNFEIIEQQEKSFKSKIVSLVEEKIKNFQGESFFLKNREKTFIVAQGGGERTHWGSLSSQKTINGCS